MLRHSKLIECSSLVSPFLNCASIPNTTLWLLLGVTEKFGDTPETCPRLGATIWDTTASRIRLFLRILSEPLRRVAAPALFCRHAARRHCSSVPTSTTKDPSFSNFGHGHLTTVFAQHHCDFSRLRLSAQTTGARCLACRQSLQARCVLIRPGCA